MIDIVGKMKHVGKMRVGEMTDVGKVRTNHKNLPMITSGQIVSLEHKRGDPIQYEITYPNMLAPSGVQIIG